MSTRAWDMPPAISKTELLILMSVSFSVILDVSLSWPDLPRVPTQLDNVTGELCGIWRQSRSRQPKWTLAIREWVYYVAGAPPKYAYSDVACWLHPGLEGPLDFHVVPHRGFAIAGHAAPWKCFLQDLDE